MSVAITGFSGAEYNAVAETAQLKSVQLLKLATDMTPEHVLKGELKLTFRSSLKSCKYDDVAKAAEAIFRFVVMAKKGRSRAFRCEAQHAVLYNRSCEPNGTAASSYCKLVGRMTAYPYSRAVVAQMAGNASATQPPLQPISGKPTVPKTRQQHEDAIGVKPGQGGVNETQ